MILITTIPKLFWIIIRHRSNSNLELSLVVYLAPFQCCFFVYLYLVVNLYDESNFYWHFAYYIKNVKNINGTKWHIVNLPKKIF